MFGGSQPSFAMSNISDFDFIGVHDAVNNPEDMNRHMPVSDERSFHSLAKVRKLFYKLYFGQDFRIKWFKDFV